MKLHYYPETDSLYIELKAAPDINGASSRFDLTTLETIALPLTVTKAA